MKTTTEHQIVNHQQNNSIVTQAVKRIARIGRLVIALLVALVCLPSAVAQACPTCKDSLTEQYVNAYGLSIVFMMMMPFLIFGSLALYFYYEVRKARAQAAAAKLNPSSASEGSLHASS